MNYKRMFIRVRDGLSGGTPIKWDDVCELVGIQVPIKTEVEKEIWESYIAKRNSFIHNVNKLAKKYNQNWRLKSYEWGRSIIKYEDGELAHMDILTRCKRAAQGFDHMREEWRGIGVIESLPSQDRRMLRNISDTFAGASMAIRGSIQSMRSISAKEKQILMDFFDMGNNGDEDS